MADRADAHIRMVEAGLEDFMKKLSMEDCQQNGGADQAEKRSESGDQQMKDLVRKTTQVIRILKDETRLPQSTHLQPDMMHMQRLYLTMLQTANQLSADIGELGRGTPHRQIAQLEQEYEYGARILERTGEANTGWTRIGEKLEKLLRTVAGRQLIKELGAEDLADELEKFQAQRQAIISLRESHHGRLSMTITERKRIRSGQRATAIANKATSRTSEESTTNEGVVEDKTTTLEKTTTVHKDDELENTTSIEGKQSSEMEEAIEDDWVVVDSSKSPD